MPGLRIFKYTVYTLLIGNVGLFLIEDVAARQVVFRDDLTWPRFIEAYAPTMDTAAWVVLLLLFEIETAVLSEETLRPGWAKVMSGTRSAVGSRGLHQLDRLDLRRRRSRA